MSISTLISPWASYSRGVFKSSLVYTNSRNAKILLPIYFSLISKSNKWLSKSPRVGFSKNGIPGHSLLHVKVISKRTGLERLILPSKCSHKGKIDYNFIQANSHKPVQGRIQGGGFGGSSPPPFPKVGGSTVCARAASRNYNWTIYSRNSLIRTLWDHTVFRLVKSSDFRKLSV